MGVHYNILMIFLLMGPVCCIHYVQLFKFAVAISTHITEIIKHCEECLWGNVLSNLRKILFEYRM